MADASRSWHWLVLASFLATPIAVRAAPDATTETILFIRHGEKGPKGLGQISCRGLNRAMALPSVLALRYKHVDAVFAPDPSHQKPDGALSYDYVRPLATVEPTAVWFGLPVHAAIGYEETDKLHDALLTPEFRNATVLVAWEHHALDDLVPALVAKFGGDASKVSKWERDDFDSIWRVTLKWTGDKAEAGFALEKQGLDDQSDLCPNAVAPPMGRTPALEPSAVTPGAAGDKRK